MGLGTSKGPCPAPSTPPVFRVVFITESTGYGSKILGILKQNKNALLTLLVALLLLRTKNLVLLNKRHFRTVLVENMATFLPTRLKYYILEGTN